MIEIEKIGETAACLRRANDTGYALTSELRQSRAGCINSVPASVSEPLMQGCFESHVSIQLFRSYYIIFGGLLNAYSRREPRLMPGSNTSSSGQTGDAEANKRFNETSILD
jgi:hypothetical protein